MVLVEVKSSGVKVLVDGVVGGTVAGWKVQSVGLNQTLPAGGVLSNVHGFLHDQYFEQENWFWGGFVKKDLSTGTKSTSEYF